MNYFYSSKDFDDLIAKSHQFFKVPLFHLDKTISQILKSKDNFNFKILENKKYLYSGKRLRSIMIFLSSEIWKLNENSSIYLKIVNIAAATEIIHLATLIHDDINDQSSYRHNVKTYHTYWGNLTAVLFGDFLFSEAFYIIIKSKNWKIINNFAKTIRFLCKGELIQNLYKNNFDLKIKDYLQVIYYKTALLIGESHRVGLIYLNKEKSLIKSFYQLGLNLGIVFQILDDYLDFNSNNPKLGKPSMQDFFEGYFTLPILFLIKENSFKDSKTFLKELKNIQKEKNKEHLKELLNNSEAFSKTMDLAKVYIQRSYKILESLEGKVSKELLYFFDTFLKFLLKRSF